MERELEKAGISKSQIKKEVYKNSMTIVIGDTGKQYYLAEKSFSSGGEGELFDVTNTCGLVAKIYHPNKITLGLGTKIRYMLEHKPCASVLDQVAWPHDIIYDIKHNFCGFIMKKLSISNELSELYRYPPHGNSRITTEHKIIVATNISSVIAEVHKAGYVFGDFNPRNIGVDMETGYVVFLDTDSYHIVIDKASNNAFRCNVGFDGYIAPELLKKIENIKTTDPLNANYEKAPLNTFTVETDNFALAIHIFKLLMNGFTPFNGVSEYSTASQAAPGVGNDAIKRNNYCFKSGNKPLSPAVPPLQILPKDIRTLFDRAFVAGRVNPKLRPSANEWYVALNNYHNNIKRCTKDHRHYYYISLKCCPFCESDRKYKNAMSPKLKQKAFAAPPLGSSNNILNQNNITLKQSSTGKGHLKFYGIRLLLSSIAVWFFSAYIVPILFNSVPFLNVPNNLYSAIPYIVLIGGIAGGLFYNIKLSRNFGAKEYIASILVSLLVSTLLCALMYVLGIVLR
jgi:serine/threonine protein kinase